MSRREWHDLFDQSCQIFGLRSKDISSVVPDSVIQWPDSDRISGGDICILFPVVHDQGKLCIQHAEQIRSVLPVKRRQDLAVRITDKGIAFLNQIFFQRTKSINLSVAGKDQLTFVRYFVSLRAIFQIRQGGCCAIPIYKRLHAIFRQAHDGQAVKSDPPVARIDDSAVIRPPGFRCQERLLYFIIFSSAAAEAKYRAHGTPPALI